MSVESTNINYISLSELLYRDTKYIPYSELALDKVEQNQYILVNKVQQLANSVSGGCNCLELHTVIEMNNDLFLVPEFLLRELPLDFTFFIFNSPEKIYRQRKVDKKNRIKKSIQQIDFVQSIALNQYKKAFKDKKAYIINANQNQNDEIKSIIQAVCG